jgi:hypothetical protein
MAVAVGEPRAATSSSGSPSIAAKSARIHSSWWRFLGRVLAQVLHDLRGDRVALGQPQRFADRGFV